MNISISNFDTVDSTNLLARTRAEEGAPEGTVIAAEIQTAGRGRKGDHWFSGRGGLWFTLILRPDVSPQKSILLPLLMGFAVHRAVSTYDISAAIKLPNDVMVGNKKLCGILCENRIHKDRIRYILVGVGINVLNDPPDVGVSLKGLTPTPPKPGELIRSVLGEFEKEYDQFCSFEYFFGEEFEKERDDKFENEP